MTRYERVAEACGREENLVRCLSGPAILIQLLESPIPSPTTPTPTPTPTTTSQTKRGSIDPMVSKRPEKSE